jgi:hypothetical protein
MFFYQCIAFGLQLRPGRARDDSGDAAAMGKKAIRRIDDGVDRLAQEVSPDDPEEMVRRYFFLREDFFLRGTFPPARRASDRPIAIACLRLFTFLPERPLFSVPRLRSCIAFFTFCCAFLPYLAMDATFQRILRVLLLHLGFSP